LIQEKKLENPFGTPPHLGLRKRGGKRERCFVGGGKGGKKNTMPTRQEGGDRATFYLSGGYATKGAFFCFTGVEESKRAVNKEKEDSALAYAEKKKENGHIAHHPLN